MYLTMNSVDATLLREQRNWLLEQDGPQAEGLVNLCEAMLDAIEAAPTMSTGANPSGARRANTLDAVHALLSGVEWSPGTVQAIADALVTAGYRIDPPAPHDVGDVAPDPDSYRGPDGVIGNDFPDRGW